MQRLYLQIDLSFEDSAVSCIQVCVCCACMCVCVSGCRVTAAALRERGLGQGETMSWLHKCLFCPRQAAWVVEAETRASHRSGTQPTPQHTPPAPSGLIETVLSPIFSIIRPVCVCVRVYARVYEGVCSWNHLLCILLA